MHNNSIGSGELESLGGEAVAGVILVCTGQQGAFHALGLQSQHDDHIDAIERRIEVGKNLDAKVIELARDERVRAGDPDLLGAQRAQCVKLRSRHPRVGDVADNGYRQFAEVTLVVTDGKHIQHRLRRV